MNPNRASSLRATIVDLRSQMTALLRKIDMSEFAFGEAYQEFDLSGCNDFISHLHRVHRLRLKAFGRNFLDEAWYMLLDLLQSEKDGTVLNVSSLCATTSRSQARALRMIRELEKDGLVARKSDPTDLRRIILMPTAKARESMMRLHRYVARESGMIRSQKRRLARRKASDAASTSI